MLADDHVPAWLALTPTLTDLEQNQHAFVDGVFHLAIYRDSCLPIYLGCSHTDVALVATHFIVLGEEIGFCDVGTEENVAHQVDEAQAQALESRYGAEKKGGGHSAQRPLLPPLSHRGELAQLGWDE